MSIGIARERLKASFVFFNCCLGLCLGGVFLSPFPAVSQTQNSSTVSSPQNIQATTIPTGYQGSVESLIFSPDSLTLISGGGNSDPRIQTWSVAGGEALSQLGAQNSGILTLAITPNGQTLISSGEDADIHFWDWQNQTSQTTFFEHQTKVLALAVTPDSRMVVSASLDGIRVWQVSPPSLLYQLSKFGDSGYSLAIHPNGYLLASGGDRGQVKIWNLRNGKLVSEFTAHREPVTGLAWTPDGESLITASFDGNIKIWEVKSGHLRTTLSGHNSRINALALSPSGRILASSSRDGVRLWQVSTSESAGFFQNQPTIINTLTFSPNGQWLAGGGLDGTIYLWPATR